MRNDNEGPQGGSLLMVCSLATVPALLLAALDVGLAVCIVGAVAAEQAGVDLPLGPLMGAELIFDLVAVSTGAALSGLFWGALAAVLALLGLLSGARGAVRLRGRLGVAVASCAVSIVLGLVLPWAILVLYVGSSLSGLLV